MDKIICIGKNFSEHAKEIGDQAVEKPVLFLKPPSVLVTAGWGDTVSGGIPKNNPSVHFECELVFRILEGRLDQFSVGLDMTLRDLQRKLKDSGHPWEISKVFPTSAFVGPWISIDDFNSSKKFSLKINGKERQRGCADEMICNPKVCLESASEHFPICDGDIMFTGTPAGVGPVVSGDLAEIYWDSKLLYSVRWN